MTDELMTQAEIADKADTLREAAGDLAMMYHAEGKPDLADKIVTLFGELPDESAARLLDILRNVYGSR